jgi:uncharacterized protein YvpB
MNVLWQGMKVTMSFFLILGLVFASGVMALLLYAKFTGMSFAASGDSSAGTVAYAEAVVVPVEQPVAKQPEVPPLPASRILDAPLIRQHPELPAGCEVTSLAMLLQYYGVNKSKTELAKEMPYDPTPISFNNDGSIKVWGNPNLGFVGKPDGSARGFGIYHAGLISLMKAYVPTAIDLTRQPFDKLEKQVLSGIPVVVWTTIDFKDPAKWVQWDTTLGPIRTTFMEHAVLMVGVDEQYVYVNDPYSGRKQLKLDKESFLSTWEAMGRQALSYTNE